MSSDLIRLEGPELAIEVLPLGATLHRLEVREADGGWRNLVLSRPDVTVFADGYLGASVGRYANRIGGAAFELDGVRYELAANEGANQLHGGPQGFSLLHWTAADVTPEAVTFTLVSPDGDQGFPGEVEVSARFELIPGGARVTYTATTTAPTVINLTTHPYFRLGGETIEGHTLTVHADSYTPVGADLIPTGEVMSVAGTPLDLRSGAVLGAALAGVVEQGIAAEGIDHNFVVEGSGLRELARLVGPDDVTLVVRSDTPAVQIYSGEAFGRTGVAIETQNYPDAPNHPNFPSAVLRPGEVYRATTEWLVSAPGRRTD